MQRCQQGLPLTCCRIAQELQWPLLRHGMVRENDCLEAKNGAGGAPCSNSSAKLSVARTRGFRHGCFSLSQSQMLPLELPPRTNIQTVRLCTNGDPENRICV